jgi:rhamnogalacturonan endolyase
MSPKCLIAVVFFAIVSVAIAEDSAERAYFTPALPPKHKEKPPVKGWASKRIEEKLNRGLVVVSKGDGSVYLSWRWIKDDDPKIAFNVYRSIGGTPEKLNKTPIIATTDFIDATAPCSGKATYWVRTVDENMREAACRLCFRVTIRLPKLPLPTSTAMGRMIL